jgi:hypothetical protein
MEARKVKAFRGFGKVNLNRIEFTFGMWNNRVLDTKGVTEMMQNMVDHSLNNITEPASIPVVISNKQLDFTTLYSITEISDEMPFTTFLSPVDRLIAASGQHRTEAHRRLQEKAPGMIKAAKQRLEDDCTRKKKSRLTEAQIQDTRLTLEKWEKVSKRLGFWLVKFYEKGGWHC